jgi:NAD-dependent SIR2 family protein deacetylase
MDKPMSETEGVQQPATVEQHQPEEVSQEQKLSDKEINFREMRRNFDELNKKLSEKDHVISSLKGELDSFKTKVKTAFDIDRREEYSDDDEPLTVGEFKKREAEQTRMREIEDTPKQYADYYDVIKFAEPMLKENPALIEAIEKARNPRLAAYQMVKSSYAYRAATQKSADAQEIAENLQKPKPSEALSGGSSPDLGGSRRMTLQEKAEVWKMSQRYARGG